MSPDHVLVGLLLGLSVIVVQEWRINARQTRRHRREIHAWARTSMKLIDHWKREAGLNVDCLGILLDCAAHVPDELKDRMGKHLAEQMKLMREQCGLIDDVEREAREIDSTKV